MGYGPAASAELLGLPSGMEWREVQEHVGLRPDSGWVSVESRRIEARGASGDLGSGVGVLRAGERAVQDPGSRRGPPNFANVRNGSVLVRYEFGPAATWLRTTEAQVDSRSLGRRRTRPSTGR